MKWMMALLLGIGLLGCKEDQQQTWQVSYRVIAFEQVPFQYRVSYQNPSGGTVSRGPIDTYLWESDTLSFESGATLYLEMEMIQGDTDADVQVLVNGQVHQEVVKKKGENIASLSFQL